MLKKAVREKLFTAVAMIVSRGDRIIFEVYVGREEEGGTSLTTRHLFDLASLTKPIATVTSFMKLCSDGTIELDEPVRHFFPRRRINPELKDVPLWAVLAHAGGWKDYEPFYRELDQGKGIKENLLKKLLESPPAFRPLTESRYSDLGYILAGFILEEITKTNLDLFWKGLARNLSLESEILYLPSGLENPLPVVSTGWCSWRKRWLKGEVHDENCFAMGGVAGHAGLFGTARAVRKWLVELFRIWEGKDSPLPVTQKVLRQFWERRREIPGSTWALGFDTPSTGDSTAGSFFSSKSIGHLGFTGTSFWLDLSDGFSVVLLSNRVYYPDTKEKMKKFRRTIHDLARMEYGKY